MNWEQYFSRRVENMVTTELETDVSKCFGKFRKSLKQINSRRDGVVHHAVVLSERKSQSELEDMIGCLERDVFKEKLIGSISSPTPGVATHCHLFFGGSLAYGKLTRSLLDLDELIPVIHLGFIPQIRLHGVDPKHRKLIAWTVLLYELAGRWRFPETTNLTHWIDGRFKNPKRSSAFFSYFHLTHQENSENFCGQRMIYLGRKCRAPDAFLLHFNRDVVATWMSTFEERDLECDIASLDFEYFS